MMEDQQKLTALRQQIDQVDEELVKLLNKRAQLALQVRIAKSGTHIYRPEREVEVLKHITEVNTGPLSAEAMKTLFHSVIYVCRGIQEVEVKN